MFDINLKLKKHVTAEKYKEFRYFLYIVLHTILAPISRRVLSTIKKYIFKHCITLKTHIELFFREDKTKDKNPVCIHEASNKRNKKKLLKNVMSQKIDN